MDNLIRYQTCDSNTKNHVRYFCHLLTFSNIQYKLLANSWRIDIHLSTWNQIKKTYEHRLLWNKIIFRDNHENSRTLPFPKYKIKILKQADERVGELGRTKVWWRHCELVVLVWTLGYQDIADDVYDPIRHRHIRSFYPGVVAFHMPWNDTGIIIRDEHCQCICKQVS